MYIWRGGRLRKIEDRQIGKFEIRRREYGRVPMYIIRMDKRTSDDLGNFCGVDLADLPGKDRAVDATDLPPGFT